jgi:Zn-finger nucleic acid-binding protein
MMRHVYGPEADVHVDQCAGCGGFWLDAGELAAIRAQFETAARRELAFERNFNVEIGVELALAAAREARRRQTLAELGGIFRFIFPPSSRRRRR